MGDIGIAILQRFDAFAIISANGYASFYKICRGIPK